MTAEYSSSFSFQPHRNLSQLPNFAFSVPLAMFHRAREGEEAGEGEGEREEEASRKLQKALITFPSVSHSSKVQLSTGIHVRMRNVRF